jgi:hypothetical protein
MITPPCSKEISMLEKVFRPLHPHLLVRITTLFVLLTSGWSITSFNLVTAPLAQAAASTTSADSVINQYFPETKHTVSGKFLDYWNANGGLPVFGYPITDAQNEVDPETGKIFLTQWFERNRFELHPELAGTKYEVELGLLGKDLNRQRLTTDPAFLPAQPYVDPGFPNDPHLYISQTHHNLRTRFLNYWLENGSVDRLGYPISEEITEIEPETGEAYNVQWFERARMEYHPELANTKYEVLLGLLGNQIKHQMLPLWQTPISLEANTALDKQDNLFVLDFFGGTTRSVQKFDNTGHLVSSFTLPVGNKAGQISTSYAFVVDSHDNLYIADNSDSGQRIQKFDSKGTFLFQIVDALGTPYLDSQDNLYVVLIGDKQIEVQKYDSQGHGLANVRTNGMGVTNVNYYPSSVTFDSQGYIYTSNGLQTIQKFDSQGNFLLQWGGVGQADGLFGDCTNVHACQTQRAGLALATDSQDNIYATDFWGGRIQKFDRQGHFLAKWGEVQYGSNKLELPYQLAIDSHANLLITTKGYLDALSSQVKKFQLPPTLS